QAGDAEAQFQLANLYQYGRGVKTDAKLARKWLEESAEQSHPPAQYHLALAIKDNDYSRALALLSAAHDQSYAPATQYISHLKNVSESRSGSKDTQVDLWFAAAR